MNREQTAFIVNAIKKTHYRGSLSHFVKFETDKTFAYVPRTALPIYLETGQFEYQDDTLKFSEHVNTNEAKSQSLEKVNELAIEKGFIPRKPAHYRDQTFAVGGSDRLQNPECVRDRAYDIFGSTFDVTGVLVCAIQNGKRVYLLQIRGKNVIAPNVLDVTAAGGVVSPQSSTRGGIKDQIQDELSPNFNFVANMAEHIATASYLMSVKNGSVKCLQPADKDLYTASVPVHVFNAMAHCKTDEAAGYVKATADDVVKFGLNGKIPPALISTFMGILIGNGDLDINKAGVREIYHTLRQTNFNYTPKALSKMHPHHAKLAA